MSKIIAVTGATGSQGGGLARAILDDPRHGEPDGFTLRAITRNRNGAKARALASAGADVVVADLTDPDSLTAAFTGAHGAYCVTNYWEHMDPSVEDAQARNLARAAKDAGLRHVIWSTLEDTREAFPLDDDRMPTLLGRYKVPHFDVKADANRYFRELGVPTTFLHPPFYWDNLASSFPPTTGEDGTLAIRLPMGTKKLAGIAADDIGRCAFGVFQRGDEFVGEAIGIAGEQLTLTQIAAAMSRVLGREIAYIAVSPEDFRSGGFPGSEDLGNMFQFYADTEADYCAFHDPAFSRALNPELKSFDQWLQANADRFTLP
ncbi:NmrA/HSCARG family protein [Mycobacterium koreense]|uniref:Nucleoside-diphosphate sugar epimerase n=1 Tax=Mycolicibacillus koreensis TaxID=1069220 RepID=A0A7I7SEY0_9MYCO|nr:NmrA/HSCARG family protein [Mycolicibacillus koreensis]MCV7248533.1 NmrA/HSCARG family protein [Mycolicibacillus koreensis]ODR11793.1 nucleoside-diphosphate sugar epimerase [Mycolicibacillus koreensis]OSC32707.1 nucleoside-diphosphate sugar epimerase [Mycolicibacillus koreensis]BBY55492.1 nucleotide-diphosphate-sugar epimerase [Mycolicibacillus koreensis]